jgi:aldehyde dehydrogenase (NAD+)
MLMAASEGQVLIDGRWREAASRRSLPVVNPSDGETFAAIARAGAEDVDAAVAAARRSLEADWGRMPAFERGRILARLGQLVLERVDELAMLEARDVGKPLRQARADAVALARYFEFYGGAADKVHGQTIPYHAGYTVLTLREPHGVTGHIIPGTIRCRSSGAASARRSRWATPACSDPGRTRR